MSSYIPPTSRRRLPGRPPYVVTALRRKYAELLGLGDDRAKTIGGALLIFNPDEDLAAIRPVRPYKGCRERWIATVFSILRHSERPMTGRELAYAVMQERGVSRTDLRRLKSIECGLQGVLERLEGDGIKRVPGRPKRWALAGESASV